MNKKMRCHDDSAFMNPKDAHLYTGLYHEKVIFAAFFWGPDGIVVRTSAAGNCANSFPAVADMSSGITVMEAHQGRLEERLLRGLKEDSYSNPKSFTR